MSRVRHIALYCLLFFLPVCGYCAESFEYDPDGLRDPLIPLVTSDGRLQRIDAVSPGAKKKDQEFKIEGIIYDKYGISYAVINGIVAKVGDSIDDYQVLAIQPKKVIFIKEGQTKEVGLEKEE